MPSLKCLQELFGTVCSQTIACLIITVQVNELLTKNCIGVAMEGVALGRNGRLCWIQLATASHVFLFDMLALGDDAFDEGLRDIMESRTVQKVCDTLTLSAASHDLIIETRLERVRDS